MRNRRIAVAPTDVCTDAVVAGQPPPWCCAQAIATPVGQPLKTQPAGPRSSASASPATSSPGAWWIVPVRLPSSSRERRVELGSSA